MKKTFYFFCVTFLFSVFLFAEVTVVNPVSGEFSNMQTLVIESNDGEDIYYSFSGSDPLSSGFAYDGPVLLDVTGNVELRVVSIDKNLRRNEIQISYTVTPTTTENTEHQAFLSSFESGAVVDYVAGEKIAIPFTMRYSFGEAFEKGKEISIAKDAIVERYLPISLRNENNEWRYVLHIVPSSLGGLSQKIVPFKIIDWTKLTFTDPRMIYSLDGASWWYNAYDVITLDRSKTNTVYYQSADYLPENPITKITLPPKPSLKVEKQYGGSVKVSVAENAFSEKTYQLVASPYAKKQIVADGFYSEILIDVFPGDKIESIEPFDVYSEGVYQGTLFASVAIDRTSPNIPIIKSSTNKTYSRENVNIIASAPKNLKLFVAISDAVEIPISFDVPKLSQITFNEPTYAPYKGDVITFFADTEKILAYKISFYSEDSFGVKSETVSYSVIVDKYNYYVDSSSTLEVQDGTPFAPLKDLSQLAKIVNKNDFTRFCINGLVRIGAGEVSINSNVEFFGMNEAKIEIPETSVVILKNSGLFAQNIIWQKILKSTSSKKTRGAAKALTNMFVIENSAVTFNNCGVFSNFSGDGTALNLSASSLNLNKTVITNNAQRYSSVLNALMSKIKINDSRLLCVSDTGVGVSVNGGNLDMQETFIQVTARMARIAELIDTTVSLENNRFTAEITPPNPTGELIYKTVGTKFIKNSGNIIQ